MQGTLKLTRIVVAAYLMFSRMMCNTGPDKKMQKNDIAATLTCVAKTTKDESHHRSDRSLGHIRAEKIISFNYH